LREVYLDLRSFYQQHFILKNLITRNQAEQEILVILESVYKIKERSELFQLLECFQSFTPLVSDKKIKEQIEVIKSKRLKRIPIQYILGRAYFLDLVLKVDQCTLIPRPETEIIVELALKEISKLSFSKKLKVLEIGTGTACISIALARDLLKKYKNRVAWEIKATDLSAEALAVAYTNLKSYKLEELIKLERTDLLSKKDQKKEWDLIISNPPYLQTDEYLNLEPEVKKEPKLALLADEREFLLFYKKFTKLNLKYKKAIFEINQNYFKETEKIFRTGTDSPKTSLIKDYSNNFRFLIVDSI